MTTPDVPLRLEFTVEVPGSPEQVWAAIATAGGLSSWFLPTELEERDGGAVLTHMGGDQVSPATITAWDPPRRIAYEEPEWATLVGRPTDGVTPMATEFLVEARSGGTCVVRVVSSAYGTGAEWEQEFMDGMADGWLPFFDNLRLYLAHFAGQRAHTFTVDVQLAAPTDDVMATIRDRLGVDAGGAKVAVEGRTGVVERYQPAVLIRLTAPVPGILRLWAWTGGGDDGATAQALGYLFGDGAAAAVEQEQAVWSDWLEALDVPTRDRAGLPS